MKIHAPAFFLLFTLSSFGQNIGADISGVRPGPIRVQGGAANLRVEWPDEQGRSWTADFSLDPKRALIGEIAVAGKPVLNSIRPFYQCQTGRRRGGFDAFFDFPGSAPEGTRSFIGEFQPRSATVRTIGERVEVAFSGMTMGIFTGEIRYVFYPGSRLIEQQAAMKTQQADVAYIYDAGIRMDAAAEQTAGGTMNSEISYFDTAGKLQSVAPPYGSERQPATVRYRAIAARAGGGSVAVFPAPHQYLFARDYTTNMGYVWYKAWRGNISLGIRQHPDDDSPYYPWMNAPPGTEQLMRMFVVVSDGPARATLDHVLRYTHSDRFEKLPGYVTFAPHWHLAYTMQARDRNFQWEPPFEPAMKAAGIEAAMIMDYHGDGHPRDTGKIRLQELADYFRACKVRSAKDYLLIPSEEANVILGGHWAIVFPKPVYWIMDRKAGEPFVSQDPAFGKVYRVGNPKEIMDMVRLENGYVYQTHPRTKGSTGFPDEIENTDHFRDPRYLGSGWKAMPSDLSSPRLNVNYVRLPALPSYNNYGQLLEAVARGDYFIGTGEITIPDAKLWGVGDRVSATVTIDHTFPLNMAEIVWGDGKETHRKIIPLDRTREFGHGNFEWTTDARDWKWARLAVWDVAGDGAFTNPIWR